MAGTFAESVLCTVALFFEFGLERVFHEAEEGLQ
jgi:hypothetical protein